MKRGYWIALIVVLLLLALAVSVPFIINRVVSKMIDQTLSPIEEVNTQLKTQVADLLHPTPTIIPDPITIVREVRTLARLETIQYSIEKVITAEVGQGAFGFLIGDRLLFVAHGYVIAGVDLEKLGPNDITVEGDTVYVTMPEAEVFVATLDNEKSYVYDRNQGILSHGDPNLETNARRVAEQEIEKAAIDDGILKLANQNAEYIIGKLVVSLGYKEVVFERTEPLQ